MKLTVTYDILPKKLSVAASVVMDCFGIGFESGRHVIVEGLELPIKPGDVVAFTGESGAGKSSLLRAAAAELGRGADLPGCSGGGSGRGLRETPRAAAVLDIDSLALGDAILVDALGLPPDDAMALLARCGMGEARLMLRTPAELSDGQRYRFRLALALSKSPRWIVADEFTATLDRPLARIVAANVRRIADRTGTGFLVATTHEDTLGELQPDLHVRCAPGGIYLGPDKPRGEMRERPRPPRRAGARIGFPFQPTGDSCGDGPSGRSPSHGGWRAGERRPPLFDELCITTGSRADWPYFARWHYRSHRLGPVKFVTLLWHGEVPIGICVFQSPPMSLRQRNRYFGLSGKWTRAGVKSLNRSLAMLSRVVLHPGWRGAGIAAAFVRASCRAAPFDWIEALAQMGHVNPFFERAGFVRVGVSRSSTRTLRAHSVLWGGGKNHGRTKRPARITAETHAKSRHAEPIYYIFDNRGRPC